MTDDEIIVAYLVGMMLWHSKYQFPFGCLPHPNVTWCGLYDASNENVGGLPRYAPDCLK